MELTSGAIYSGWWMKTCAEHGQRCGQEGRKTGCQERGKRGIEFSLVCETNNKT